MSTKKTTAEFVADARKVHGDRYDYSRVRYVGSHDIVQIVCSVHGAFEQSPTNHLSGNGCPICADVLHGDRRRSTTDAFVKRAREVHDDRYDYTLVQYCNNRTKVQIICGEHGIFEQAPDHHLGGKGCLKCAIQQRGAGQRFTKDEFVECARSIHGVRYDYSKVAYVNNSTKVIIVCSVHGDFEQSPNGHLSGRGCAKCGNDLISDYHSYTQEEFVTEANRVHEGVYDYSKVEYTDGATKVRIICQEHGVFEQKPASHLQGKGCWDCGGSKPGTKEEFIAAAKQTHGGLYDYSKVAYVNRHTKVQIVCPEHGVFEQTPAKHLFGHGCPMCSESRGERAIALLLTTRSLRYEQEKRFNTCRNKRPLPFDFHVPSLRVLIEFHGKQHFEPVYFGGGGDVTESFWSLQDRDCIKRDWAAENGYNLIEIRYDDDVDAVLSERLCGAPQTNLTKRQRSGGNRMRSLRTTLQKGILPLQGEEDVKNASKCATIVIRIENRSQPTRSYE